MPSDDETTATRAVTGVAVRRPADLGGERAVVHALVAAARAVDGGEPLSEDARLVVDGTQHPGVEVRHLVTGGAGGGPVTGYAQVRLAEPVAQPRAEVTVELLVAPSARRTGVGTALSAAVADVVGAAGTADRSGALTAWSHGDHPGAAALARRHGLDRERELWRMERAADGGAALPPLDLPDGAALRAFEPGRDDAAWLALNAAAFVGHPEQGAWGPDDLAARTGAPWFDPADLLLLVDAADPDRLLASHWTKVEGPLGEVYVVAVAPAEQGRGLGGAVVLAGLHHLAGRGVARVDLYVGGGEADARARRLYERLGFTRASTDVAWGVRW